MSTGTPDLAQDPAGPPRSNGELVFGAPWEGRAFGMAMALQRGGHLEWGRFRDLLVSEIAASDRRASGGGDPTAYYRSWLAALEGVVEQLWGIGPEEVEVEARRILGGDHHRR
ncbi:MAG: nitrile hydratase accessory protein [Acidimicrobiales bacterium]